jgi:hypothetical protein
MYLTDKLLLSMLEINIYVTSQFGMHPNLDWDHLLTLLPSSKF